MKTRGGHADPPGDRPRDVASPSVVIAHGAWADATSWREVIALPQARGLRVVAVQNPLSALADDVDAVTRVLTHQPSPVVLVGHGYGGTVITQAGRHQGVTALVYIAAWAPDSGESTADLQTDHSTLPVIGRLEVDAGGYLYLAPDAVLEFLAHDLPAPEGLVLAAAQQPIRASALLDRVSDAAWRSTPSWYAVTGEIRRTSQRYFFLVLALSGSWQVTHVTRTRFGPGDLIFYDSRYPLDAELLNAWSAFNLQLSEQFVRKWVPHHAVLSRPRPSSAPCVTRFTITSSSAARMRPCKRPTSRVHSTCPSAHCIVRWRRVAIRSEQC